MEVTDGQSGGFGVSRIGQASRRGIRRQDQHRSVLSNVHVCRAPSGPCVDLFERDDNQYIVKITRIAAR